MKYSLSWMKEHVSGTLPEVSELRRVITMNAFEVEEAEAHGSDTVFDIKVLPDRAHDALSHRGMAREIAGLLGLSRMPRKVSQVSSDASVPPVVVDIKDSTLCPRYIGVRVDGVAVTPSPAWLKEKLEGVGQRSINTLVDLTNFVLLDIGQPMHAFDAAKVKGGIIVRLAEKGEAMTTLDNKALTFDGTELVIADDEAVLALAGVKGGKKAEVDATTTSIIVESANFDPSLTRRTSTKHGIKTDASKRYENGITSNFAEEGVALFLSLLHKEQPTIRVGAKTDCYPNPESWIYKVGVSARDINRTLGTGMTDDHVEQILKRLGYGYEYVSLKETLELNILKVLGKAYKNPSSMRMDAQEAFSCSSLVSYLYTLAGIAMPSLSVDKYIFGKKVEKSDLKYGDLVFSNSGEGRIYKETVEYLSGTSVPEGIDHVGIYMGDGKVLHASKSTSGVVTEDLSSSKQFTNTVGYRRIVENIDTKRFVVSIPAERLDLRITEDMVEEIGRHFGYDKIAPVAPKLDTKGIPNKRLYYANKVRKLLVERGFSEVYTYSFARNSEGGQTREVLNPVGDDRPFLRQSLIPYLQLSLGNNQYFGPLLGIDDAQVFEIGNIFSGKDEHTKLAIGTMTSNKKRKKTLVDEINNLINAVLTAIAPGITLDQRAVVGSMTNKESSEGQIREINFDSILEKLPEPTQYDSLGISRADTRYQTLSAYPFIVRDIALFVPADIAEEKPPEVIKKAAGDLVVRFSRFDKFQKPGEDRISCAYRLVFQAFDRTLTDEEINPIMARVTDACTKEGWQVR